VETLNRADRPSARRPLLDLPLHPPLFAATVVVAYWVDTVVSPHAAFRSLLVAIAGAVILTGIVWLFTRSLPRAGIIVTCFIGLLYSKHFVEFAINVRDLAPTWVFVAWILAILAAIALVVRFVRTRAENWTAWRANSVLNWAAILYLGSTIGMGMLSGKFAHAASELDQGVPLAQAEGSVTTSTSKVSRPDIYLILLDGYPRADVLQEAFDFDNAPFVDALHERGFTVATESHSNYLWTRQSLTSMLHMKYVEQIPEFRAVLEHRAPQNPDLRDLVIRNPVFDLARENGYQVVATGYEFEELAPRQADVYVDPGYLNEFEFKLLVSTFLGDGLAVMAPDLASSQHRNWINFQLRSLGEIAAAAANAPRLVVGHIPAPHQPTSFGPNGEPIVVPISRLFYADSPLERGEPLDEFADKYRDQLGYLNGRFLETVDAILANSAQPPVIILWADHGSASHVDWVVTTPDEAEPSALRERTSTLFAALTPGRTDVFPNDISPVNIFRFLADAYLGTDLGRATPLADGP
jgi:hypothetical protein